MAVIFYVTYDRYDDLTELKIENYELYQYFGGIKFEYTGELSFKSNGELVSLKQKDIEIEVDSTPIYFMNIENEMIEKTKTILKKSTKKEIKFLIFFIFVLFI